MLDIELAYSFFNKKKSCFEQVNFSSGRYFQGGKGNVGSRLPFDAGFEVWEKSILLSHFAISNLC